MKLKKKSNSWLMKIIDKIPFVIPKGFMSRFWTTIGKTVYVPTRHDNDPDWGSFQWKHRNRSILEHEKVHTEQYSRFGPLFYVLYLGPSPFLLPFCWLSFPYVFGVMVLLLPLSVGLAWGRFYLEREAYITHINTQSGALWVSNTLWYNYFFTWPKSWTLKWFLRRL